MGLGGWTMSPMPPFARLFVPLGSRAFRGFISACVSGRGTSSSANAGNMSANAATTMSERTNQRTRIRGAPLHGEARATSALPTVRPTHTWSSAERQDRRGSVLTVGVDPDVATDARGDDHSVTEDARADDEGRIVDVRRRHLSLER